MATEKPASKQSKMSKLIKAPLKILIKARDFYIKSMSEYADRIGYGTAMGCPAAAGPIYTLPKSYSVNSARSSSSRDEDYRELLRAASTRGLRSSKNELGVLQRQKSTKSPIRILNNNNNMNMPRSRSVAIGRIDEEKPCEHFEDVIEVKTNVFPRSRSYAVSRTRRTSTKV